MRYISKYDRMSLIRENGDTAYVFKQGTLDLGSGVVIDASLKSGTDLSLMLVLPTDTAGKVLGESGASRIELAGQGKLDGTPEGMNGLFFEAPLLTAPTDVVAAVAKLKYKVNSGTVTYKGITYKNQETFYADGTTTAVTGTGTFSLCIPNALKNEYDMMLDEQFAIKHLQDPNQVTGYYDWNTGFLPNNSLMTSDVNSYFA